MTNALIDHEGGAARDSDLEEWTPPRKKLALQTSSHGIGFYIACAI